MLLLRLVTLIAHINNYVDIRKDYLPFMIKDVTESRFQDKGTTMFFIITATVICLFLSKYHLELGRKLIINYLLEYVIDYKYAILESSHFLLKRFLLLRTLEAH